MIAVLVALFGVGIAAGLYVTSSGNSVSAPADAAANRVIEMTTIDAGALTDAASRP
jgi:hypothetical protein